MKCQFNLAWIGKCGEETKAETVGYCKIHRKVKCQVCGGQAIRQCSCATSLVCGRPLCNNCNCPSHGEGY